MPLSGDTLTSGYSLGSTGTLAAAIVGFARPGQAVATGIGSGLAEAFIADGMATGTLAPTSV